MRNPFRKRYQVIITTRVPLAGSSQTLGHKFWFRRSAEWHGKQVILYLAAYYGYVATYEILELP